jgi:site-specific DNA-methyltransferase (adenine-specific)
MRNLEDIINTIINGDSVEVMKEIPNSVIDLIVTSPKYNVGIDYDSCDDRMSMKDYWEWTEQWLTESFKLLKDDGRIAINIPYEVNVQDRGGRVLFMAEFWGVMKKVGFQFYGLVDLDENSPHRSKTTAWGSWMSPSSPYIYNPKECVVLAYKKERIKKTKGKPEWVGEITDVEQEDGTVKKKVVYKDEDKKEFMDLVYGQWSYFADTKQQTKATFSMDIPTKAIKILTYKNDVVLDPFAGSGTSLVAAETLGRRWIGIELSENYTKIGKERVQHFVDKNKQTELEFNKGSL